MISKMRVLLGFLLMLITHVMAYANTLNASKAIAITQVYGDGVRMVAVALEYAEPVSGSDFSTSDFQIDGRTVIAVFASNSVGLTDKTDKGKYLIVQLSPDDEGVSLAYKMKMNNATTSSTPKRGGKKWVAGDKLADNLAYTDAQATVVQKDGKTIKTTAVKNLVVDDFQQLTFKDVQTGKTLKYNLFIPKNPGREPLPLVLFMHDAGVTSEYHRATLFQGLGAVVWASPEEQAKRPCIVLAPQYDEIIVDDNAQTSPMMETTIHLIENLLKQYKIDANRIYTTGQSGGCMMSIAMNIKYPDFFAAAYLVAGQWDPNLVAPLAKKKLWIMTSADDLGAFPGENAITKRLEAEGAKVSRAWWDATWNANQYRFAYDKIVSEGNPIKYTVFEKGTVFLPGAETAGASGHRNTWRVAYSIEPIREWLFEQSK
ncbi:MAG: PHB depolymerase family esterase [Prevotellaceae bacterium]|nr:PHB depolymerase family esterase [Prevotellaceae bacterium]MDY3366224.1 PHB depolymerase family esterase [Prevotella sp.]